MYNKVNFIDDKEMEKEKEAKTKSEKLNHC